MLEIVDFAKPALTVNLGDFPDNKAFSRHRRKYGEVYDPERDGACVELEAGRLEAAARKQTLWLEGNHCAWYKNYIAENAPAAEKLMPTLGEMYGIDKEPVTYQEIVKIGKVGFTHDLGHYGRQALHQTLATAGGNIVFGHTHRLGVAYSGTVEGDRWFSLNCGWLGDVDEIRYMNRAATKDWQLGFGAVRYVDGLAFASGIPMIEEMRRGNIAGKVHCFFGGKKFVG